MRVEEINADRDKLIANIAEGVEVELKKAGLRLIAVVPAEIAKQNRLQPAKNLVADGRPNF